MMQGDAPQPVRSVQVNASTGKRPRTVDHLRDWAYLEQQIHRLICAWGRAFPDWADKVAVHRHVWEQSECVRRLRERLAQFPGGDNNLDQPVSPALEALADTVLDAPTHHDFADGVYQLLNNALIHAYMNYTRSAHPVHDAPTLATLTEIATIKENMRLWLRDYRRRYPHTLDMTYRQQIEQALASCSYLAEPLPLNGASASPVGVRRDFRPPRWPARPRGSVPRHHFLPFVEADFQTEVEARRLFWAYGYMREMNLAMTQLKWLYYGHFMPWPFLQDVSRHLWDESRHGDSGYSRLLDFGITLEDVGFASYDMEEPLIGREPWRPDPYSNTSDALPASGVDEPMSPRMIYDDVFHIGMIAETGHFQVKREAYDDFKAGGDMESAEMMLFDIIDEQTHVQYAHRWLPVLAEHAGVDNSDYRERAAAKRKQLALEDICKCEQFKQRPRRETDPDFACYQRLLRIMREQQPLANVADHRPRSAKPM